MQTATKTRTNINPNFMDLLVFEPTNQKPVLVRFHHYSSNGLFSRVSTESFGINRVIPTDQLRVLTCVEKHDFECGVSLDKIIADRRQIGGAS